MDNEKGKKKFQVAIRELKIFTFEGIEATNTTEAEASAAHLLKEAKLFRMEGAFESDGGSVSMISYEQEND